ncbi:hypothetical protein DAPPUDRAFT_222518 [Daphnia pulex]|uniref:Uncharacterized protein n=1 Tax=Daphnia pulex TaxID=6669 RepID=E9G5P1_DAPPU|nr:hypothetical protein DAPPUDRAFT_222518 [Daphnia pulex]|eukprot:EFX85595.1 hypothetical protein DAPPUDRAFT_222518 [Daphnia pulex]
MSPANRYSALKNSTVVAGGADFGGGPLSMSPIRPSEQGAPTLIISTKKSNASESSKARTASSTNVTSSTSKNVQKTPLHPSTPAPFARKRKRSITQSPMFVNLMRSSVNKATSNVQHPQPSTPSTPAPASATTAASRVSVAITAQDKKQLTSTTPALSRASVANIASKGVSYSNPGKGKSLVESALVEKGESSDTEWEDEDDDQERPIPRCIAIAFEEIEDRSKDFVPLEKRLKADPVFQAKVKYQRAKVAAQKAEEAAAEAKKKEAKKKPRAVSTKKKEEDNIASVATNKGNLRFYAGTKVTKEALDAVQCTRHGGRMVRFYSRPNGEFLHRRSYTILGFVGRLLQDDEKARSVFLWCPVPLRMAETKQPNQGIPRKSRNSKDSLIMGARSEARVVSSLVDMQSHRAVKERVMQDNFSPCDFYLDKHPDAVNV